MNQELPPLPETPYQLYYEWPDDEDGYGGSEVVGDDGFTSDQMTAYAESARAPLLARVAELEAEVARVNALLERSERALLIAWGALVDLSPCAESECKQSQTEMMAFAECECKEIRRLLVDHRAALTTPKQETPT